MSIEKKDHPPTTLSLWSSLYREAQQFDFFQAVRLIELTRPENDLTKQQTHSEWIHFRTHVGLQFPTHDIAQIVAQENASPWPATTTMIVNFFGLHGVSSLLPRHYTELLLQCLQRKDTALRDFFDLYNHRMISLFYRSWEKNHLYIGYEKTKDVCANPDPLSNMLAALAGIHTSQFSSPIPTETLLYFSSYFANPRRSAAFLENLLSDYFSTLIRVKSQQMRKTKLSLPEKTRLNNYNALGVNTILGNYVSDRQLFFRIVIGPLTYLDFQTFAPHQAKFSQLIALTKNYIGSILDFDVQLLLQASEIPPLRLGKQRQLGWDTWLCAKPPNKNAAILAPFPR